MEEKELVQKWSRLIEACKKYYVDSLPTGMLDSEYDELEKLALEDGFSARDYVFKTYVTGTRVKNYYITKFPKKKAEGKMIDAMAEVEKSLGKKLYWVPKYDGSSIAIYFDPMTGKVKNINTVGNLNTTDYGISQIGKLIDFIPKNIPTGIVAIQCEAIIDLSKMTENPERARQAVNGLINSRYLDDKVNQLLTLVCYRYYIDDTVSPAAKINTTVDYRDMVTKGFSQVRSQLDGHYMFTPAQVWTLDELRTLPENFTESDRIQTNSVLTLIDGWVAYDEHGVCLGAIKFPGAGSGDAKITTTVKSIQWNDQVLKGKDSWSANVIIDPVIIKGIEIKKPSAGSVSKLITKNITPGAEVGIILANSTIPMVGDVYRAGNGDYQWPKCSCGYQLGSSDVYGSLLKCGNPMCTERIGRMTAYIQSLSDIHKDIDLNKLLVIDRFKWENTTINTDQLLTFVECGNEQGYHDLLASYLTTDLQKRNLELVWKASFQVLRSFYENGKTASN